MPLSSCVSSFDLAEHLATLWNSSIYGWSELQLVSILLVFDLFAGTISLLVNLGSLIERNVSIDSWSSLPWPTGVGFWLQSQLAVLSGHLLVVDSLHSAHISLNIVWMEKNVDDVNITGVLEQLLSSCLGHLLRLLGDSWLVSWLWVSLLVSKTVSCLLLLKSVDFEIFEMLLKRSVFSVSQVEKSGVFIIQSSFLPVLALEIVLDLKVCISLSADDEENILKVFS